MAGRSRWVPDCRDVIWIDCNPQAGREMRDRHPLLVLSPRAFNERTGIVIGLPMTTASYNESNPFAVGFQNTRGKVSYILAHQPMSFDWRARHASAHPIKRVPESAFDQARATLNQIVSLDG